MLVWARANLASGCEPGAMVRSMMDSGWGWRDACGFMEKALGARVGGAELPRVARALFGSAGCPDGRPARVAMSMEDPQIALIESFASPEEARALVELAGGALARSETVEERSEQGGQRAHPDRSSSGAYLQGPQLSLPAPAALLARASWAFGWPAERFEGLQILRYLPGQEYKPHHDWFDPSTPGGGAQLRRGGQRVGTAVVYLNDCPEGGATVVPRFGLRASARLGNAIFFSYAPDAHGFGDARLLHGGEPVARGEKWVCTLWMRQGAFA